MTDEYDIMGDIVRLGMDMRTKLGRKRSQSILVPSRSHKAHPSTTGYERDKITAASMMFSDSKLSVAFVVATGELHMKAVADSIPNRECTSQSPHALNPCQNMHRSCLR